MCINEYGNDNSLHSFKSAFDGHSLFVAKGVEAISLPRTDIVHGKLSDDRV